MLYCLCRWAVYSSSIVSMSLLTTSAVLSPLSLRYVKGIFFFISYLFSVCFVLPLFLCSTSSKRYVADVKLGLPVPDGFWACIFPQTSASTGIRADDRKLLSQDLSPGFRSRPVRVFGVCAESRKARQSFVWEVSTEESVRA